MRFLRRSIIVLFLAVCAVFAYYHTQVLDKIDREAPVITADTDDLQVSVTATTEELLAGITAADDVDGDVTDSVIVESTSKFSSPGNCTITYAAFDNAGNVSRYTRNLTYTDYESPRLYLSEPLRYNADDWNITIVDRFTAEDCIDGDITGQIKYALAENLDYTTPGDYVVAVQVSNTNGDTYKLELQAELLDEDDYAEPYPILSDYIVYTKVGKSVGLSDKHYCIGVQYGNSQYLFERRSQTTYDDSMIRISGTCDYNTPGLYRMTYTLYTENQDEEEEARGSVSQYIVVQE